MHREKNFTKNIGGRSEKFKVYFHISVLRYLVLTSLILPYLTYCNVIWSNNRITRLYRLNILQKRAIRVPLINVAISLTLNLLFAKSRQLTLIDLNKLCTADRLCTVFITMTYPNQFQNYFVLNSSIHEHLTRSHNRLHESRRQRYCHS